MTVDEWGKTQHLDQYRKSLYVFACVSKIAEKVATNSLHLFKILNSGGDTQEVFSHDIFDLLYRPNPFQTKIEFWKITVINQLLAGDAYWWKIRDNRGNVIELWNLRPDRVSIIADSVNFIKEYRLRKGDGTEIVFKPEDIVHLKSASPLSDLYGMSSVEPAKLRVQIEAEASRYQAEFFKNNARLDAIMKVPGMLGEGQADRMRSDFESKFGAESEGAKIAFLEAGMEYQQISISQKEMDFIESMKFTRDDILVAFKVPKPIVAITEDVNYANAETAMQIFLAETIKPYIEELVEKINEEMVSPDFDETFYLEADDPTPENQDKKLRRYESGLGYRYLLINEVRELEGLEPIDGGWTAYMPISDVPFGGRSGEEAPNRELAATRFSVKELKQSRATVKKLEGARKNKVYETRKQYVFQGKEALRVRLSLQEELKATLAEGLKDAGKKTKDVKDGEAPKLRALIPGEVRNEYYRLQLKKMDRVSADFKREVIGIATDQMKAVIDLLFSEKKGWFSKASMPEDWRGDLKGFFKDQNPVVAGLSIPFLTEMLVAAGKDALSLVNPDRDFKATPDTKKYLEARAKFFAKSMNKTTHTELVAALSAGIAEGEGIGELRARVLGVYDKFSDYRAEMIARTETTAANNEGTMEGYKQSGVAKGKEWIATMDSRTREEHMAMDGEVVGLDAKFSNGLEYPQEPNCRCVIAPAIEE